MIECNTYIYSYEENIVNLYNVVDCKINYKKQVSGNIDAFEINGARIDVFNNEDFKLKGNEKVIKTNIVYTRENKQFFLNQLFEKNLSKIQK